MHTFTDLSGHIWRIALTVGTMRTMKDRIGVDLFGVTSGNLDAVKTIDDPETFQKILWAMIKSQAEEDGIAEMDFWERVDGNTIESASVAFRDSLLDFFPPGRRAVVVAAIAVQESQQQLVAQRLAAIAAGHPDENAVQETAAEIVKRTLGSTSTT